MMLCGGAGWEGQLGEDVLDAAAQSRIVDGVDVRLRLLKVYHRLVPQIVGRLAVCMGGVVCSKEARGGVGGVLDGMWLWHRLWWCGGEYGW